MATQNDDPRFAEYKPGECKSCGRPLQFAFEIENGNLCTNCGPGSTKWQRAEDKKNDQEFIAQSEQYNHIRGRHGLLASSVRNAMTRNFDASSVADLTRALEQDEAAGAKQPGQLNSNAEATEERMRHTANPQDTDNTTTRSVIGTGGSGGAVAGDSRENEPPEHDTNFQTKDL